MITLFLLIILTLTTLFLWKQIKKHNIFLYILLSILSLLSMIFSNVFIFIPWIKGFLGLSLFYLVMMAGALPNWTLKKRLMSLRTEYSILGFIAITPHAIYNLLRILSGEISPTILGIIAYAIMIPLFITSFITIRKKMKPIHWKNLQRLAYIVYLLLFIHLIIHFTLPINRILYIVLLVVYIAFKSIKIIKKGSVK